jgi:hypothetical protein
MAARRLLIVMLILLGLSTLAAALIPQRTLRDGTGTRTATQPTTTTESTPEEAGGRELSATIHVGGRKLPLVASPLCAKRKPRCEPVHVGDQLSLQTYSKVPAQLEFPEFGQFSFASPTAPAFFEVLLGTPGRFGILFADPEAVPACSRALDKGSPCVAARIEVLTAEAAAKAIAPPAKGKGSKRRAREGSDRS